MCIDIRKGTYLHAILTSMMHTDTLLICSICDNENTLLHLIYKCVALVCVNKHGFDLKYGLKSNTKVKPSTLFQNSILNAQNLIPCHYQGHTIAPVSTSLSIYQLGTLIRLGPLRTWCLSSVSNNLKEDTYRVTLQKSCLIALH